MSSKRKKIIVTGGSRGIGLAVAKAFFAEGYSVLIVSRSTKELVDAQKEMKGKGQCSIVAADVSSMADRSKIRAHIMRKWRGSVDVLVNAAGIYGPIGYLEENSADKWEETIQVNLFGTVGMCALVLPFMKKQKRGRIINFSGGGEGPFPRFTAYSASKGAIVRFTESLAEEVKNFGTTINAITPGGVNTKFLEEVLVAGPEKAGKDFYRRSLQRKREGGVSPDIAAGLVLYLARNDAEFISGKVISANRDDWKNFKKHAKEMASSDVYTFRRIKPKDRGYTW